VLARRWAELPGHGTRRLSPEVVGGARPEVVAGGGDGDQGQPGVPVPNQRKQRWLGSERQDGGCEKAPAEKRGVRGEADRRNQNP